MLPVRSARSKGQRRTGAARGSEPLRPPVRVVATRSEFNSIDLILKAYAERGQIVVDWVTPGEEKRYCADEFAPALAAEADLLVVSMVFFDTATC